MPDSLPSAPASAAVDPPRDGASQDPAAPATVRSSQAPGGPPGDTKLEGIGEGSVVAERYRVERLLGRGGMGSVWASRHLSLDQVVAVKFIHPELARSEQARRRFDTEARAAAKLRSRHAVAVYDHGLTAAGQPYIVMEYLEGESLEERVQRKGALSLAEVVEVIRQAAKGLAAAHEQGIIHRDLKPENIFLARDREAGQLGYTVKIVDFGIAKMVHEEGQDQTRQGATQAGQIVGTPHFMAPETLTEATAVGPLSDIWSLGACAYSAAVGRVPFDGDAIGEVVLQVCAAPMPVPSEVKATLPREFDAWFATACQRDTSRRFPSVVAMAEALTSLGQWAAKQRDHEAYMLRARQEALDLEVPDPPRRPLGGFVVLAVLALALLAGGAFVYWRVEQANAAMLRMQQEAEARLQAAEQPAVSAAPAPLEGSAGLTTGAPQAASGAASARPGPR